MRMRKAVAVLAVLFLVSTALRTGAADSAGEGDLPVPSSVSLLEAVRHALSHSREGRIAARDVRVAEEGRVRAGARRLPRVDASSDYTTLSEDPAIFIQGMETQTMDRSVLRARVTAEQTIFDFGKTGARVSQADARIEVAERKAALTKERVAFGVIAAFLSARRAAQLLHVAEESLAAAREHRKVAGDLYDLGVVARNDLLAAEVQVANEEAALIAAENRLELSHSRLALRMGFSGEKAVTPAQGDFPFPAGPLPPLSESLGTAASKRPELQAQDAFIREGAAAVTAARAEFAPTFFGQGGYSYESNDFNPNPNVFSLVLGGKINLFSGFSDEAARREALLTVDRRKEERSLLGDEISLSVKGAHLAVTEAEKKKAVAEVAVDRAEENLRIQNNRYQEGLSISTEILDAQTLLTRAKTDLSNSVYDLYEARYRLLVERGELLDFLSPLLGPAAGGEAAPPAGPGQGR
ncbi:MAG TPA: TolC family protein [Candidatus Deferrimicrobiaceae bacterium]|nr:TolC family protein [Candidatus Deferrimicrobiaceae bacterium]